MSADGADRPGGGVPGRLLPAPPQLVEQSGARFEGFARDPDRRRSGPWRRRPVRSRRPTTPPHVLHVRLTGARTCRRRSRSWRRAPWASTPAACSSSAGSRCWRCTWPSSRSRSAARRARSGRSAPWRSLPIALFQSVGWSHDAVTTAVSLLVVSSALRALDPPPSCESSSSSSKRCCSACCSGSCKPVYVVLAGLYLLPLLGPSRRRDLWRGPRSRPLPGSSCRWRSTRSSAASGAPTPTTSGSIPILDARRDELLSTPWHFAADAVRTVGDQTWDWLEGLWSVGPSVSHWPAIVVAIAIVLYSLVSVQRDPANHRR